jgi:outer membrane protein assembly factor BamB
MTSDRSLEPIQRQLETFSDQVFQGAPSSPGDLDPATQRAVRRLHGIDRIPPFDQTRMTQRKEHLMNVSVPWQLATDLVQPVIPAINGSSPPIASMPARPTPLRRRSGTIPLISAAVLLALIGGLIFGIVQYRGGEREPTVPAFVQGTPTPEESPAIGADWSQYRGGMERTGYSSDPGPGSNLNLLWSFAPDEWVNGIVEADGVVFGFGDKGGLYAIDALTGNQIWAVDLDETQAEEAEIVPEPAAGDGMVFVSTGSGKVVAVDQQSGAVRWQNQLGNSWLWTPTYADGRVYVLVDEVRMAALDAETGDELWSWIFPGGALTQYPTFAEGKMFISDSTFAEYAIDLATGETVWATEPMEAVRTSAYGDGTLFVPRKDGGVTALDTSDGSERWTSMDPSGTVQLQPILTDDALITVTENGNARALDPATGEEIWSIPARGTSFLGPPIASRDTLYLETMPGVFISIDLATGERVGRAEGLAGAGSNRIVTGNMLIVSGLAGPVRAFVPYEATPTEILVGTPLAAPLATLEQ